MGLCRGSVLRDQSAVDMRRITRLASKKKTPYTRGCATGRAAYSEYLDKAEIFFHGRDHAPNLASRMCDIEHFWSENAVPRPAAES